MESEKKKTFKLKKKDGRFLIVAFLFCAFASYITILILRAIYPEKSTQDLGSTVSGILGTYFSFFGSILVFMALRSQIKANKIISKQFQIQQHKENIQSFENSFYNLLNIHQNIVNNIEKNYNREKIKRTPKIFLGDDVMEFTAKSKLVFQLEFDKIAEYLEDSYYHDKLFERDFNDVLEFKKKESRLSVFKKIYSVFYTEEIDNQFGNYFRNLYRLVKIIDNYNFFDDKQLDFEKKYFYTSILRAQFSDYELRWIFINGLSNYGTKFKCLIEKYSLLKNVNTKDEILINYVKFYELKAFSK